MYTLNLFKTPSKVRQVAWCSWDIASGFAVVAASSGVASGISEKRRLQAQLRQFCVSADTLPGHAGGLGRCDKQRLWLPREKQMVCPFGLSP